MLNWIGVPYISWVSQLVSPNQRAHRRIQKCSVTEGYVGPPNLPSPIDSLFPQSPLPFQQGCLCVFYRWLAQRRPMYQNCTHNSPCHRKLLDVKSSGHSQTISMMHMQPTCVRYWQYPKNMASMLSYFAHAIPDFARSEWWVRHQLYLGSNVSTGSYRPNAWNVFVHQWLNDINESMFFLLGSLVGL